MKDLRGRRERPGNGRGLRRRNGDGRGGRAFALADVLARLAREELVELYRFWNGGGAPPESPDELERRVKASMSDPALVEEHVARLGKRLAAVVETLLAAPRFRTSWDELCRARALSHLNDYDLEACLSLLGRRGLVVEGEDRRFERFGGRVVGLPLEVGESLVRRRREKGRGIFGLLTLRGHLEQVYADPARERRISAQRMRELYKMYAQETAIVARLERLPSGLRELVEKAILEFGGVLPRQLFERMETSLPHWNGRRWRMILEQSLLGSVRKLDLLRYGIQLRDETLVLFNEVAVAWLRRVAVPGDPDRPHEELSLGIDLVSNLSRFLAYIEENGVRFTVQGEIFKTTEKKILQHLIPNPGRELSREEVLRFIFRFAKRHALIDRTGKRTFRLTPEGRAWNGLSLVEKQAALLGFAERERFADGEPFHQDRLRELLLRMLKRVQPGVWYDLMYLPFLARNAYLASLDEQGIEEHFADRAQNGSFPSLEDPQRLAWNLVSWVRRRLFLLGIVDLGYDQARRPVALRLTQSGARCLGVDVPGAGASAPMGSLVVTPDFQVVLFPTGDDAELVHDLDRFCVREKLGALLHFRITQEGVRRALAAGMRLEDVQRVLEAHSRTPVPQNVRFSIGDWALRAGLMRLDEDLVLVCEEPETLRRFRQDAGTRRFVRAVLDERRLALAARMTPRRLAALLRELGYLVELGGPVA